MKIRLKFLILAWIFSISSFNSNAQRIDQVGDKFGLVDNQNKEIIPAEYDLIYRLELPNYETHFYVLKKGDKFGFYDHGSKIKSETIYDEITNEKIQYFQLKRGKLLGFMAEYEQGKFKPIEPQFEYLIRDEFADPVLFMADPLSAYKMSNRRLICCKDNLWGVISLQSGEMDIPNKYKYLIQYDRDYQYYYVKEKNTYNVTIINPKNGKEFWFDYEVKAKIIDSSLHVTSKYISPSKFKIFDFYSGEEQFSFTGESYKVNSSYVNRNILQLIEEVEFKKPNGNLESRYNWIWFSLKSKQEILYAELSFKEQLYLNEENGEMNIYIKNTHRSSYKKIGTIEGTFIKWINKTYVR
ncbi:MAG: hypothetical protein ACOVNZ_07430 [Crocinitomicaceae bacterium]